MREIGLITAAACVLCLSGCAVVESPMSWDGSSNTHGDVKGFVARKNSVPTLSPGELIIDTGQKTFEQRSDVGNYDALAKLIADTQAAISKYKSDVRLQLDYASGGNYGWGILGAGAALFSAPTDVLKGIGLLGGTHLALSNRLSPKDQLTILSDTINKLGCVDSVARAQAPAMDLAAKALSRNPTGLKSMNDAIFATTGSALPSFPNKPDYLAALRNILYAANAKMDGVFTNALANTHVGSDIVASANNMAAALQMNAQIASKQGDSVGANAIKTAADLSATVPVKLAACQAS